MEGYGNENPGAFQPTRPLRGATPSIEIRLTDSEISTHAPLAGRDDYAYILHDMDCDISTHAPLAGRDRSRPAPCRRESYFNPRAPCGARHEPLNKSDTKTNISTHAPLAGRDRCPQKGGISMKTFQPTRPLRGATPSRTSTAPASSYFNPRAPCGARQNFGRHFFGDFLFQPTRPLRGATFVPGMYQLVKSISTHAPLAGRDSKSVQITMYIFAITDKFQMLLHRMLPVRAFCSFLMQENHADLGANRPSGLCALVLRTIRSSVPRADTSACSRSVRFYSRTSCPSSKIEGCPFLGQ